MFPEIGNYEERSIKVGDYSEISIRWELAEMQREMEKRILPGG